MAQGETQKLEGDDLVLMIMEGVDDADDATLQEMAQAMLGKPVRVVGDNQFEIDW